MSACPQCGYDADELEPVTEPEATPEPPRAPTTVLECLTPGERERGARNLHELSPSRQQEVRTALGLKAARA